MALLATRSRWTPRRITKPAGGGLAGTPQGPAGPRLGRPPFDPAQGAPSEVEGRETAPSGTCRAEAQLRKLRGFRPSRRGFPSDARDGRLAGGGAGPRSAPRRRECHLPATAIGIRVLSGQRHRFVRPGTSTRGRRSPAGISRPDSLTTPACEAARLGQKVSGCPATRSGCGRERARRAETGDAALGAAGRSRRKPCAGGQAWGWGSPGAFGRTVSRGAFCRPAEPGFRSEWPAAPDARAEPDCGPAGRRASPRGPSLRQLSVGG